jgi:nitrogen fixation/metabolism regulation signal transduction histidine kinase
MKYIIAVSVLAGSVLLYLLSSNSVNTELFSANYYAVLVLTGSLAIALAGLVAYQFWRLRQKIKRKVFGARLTLRLTLFFIGIAIVPGILVYAVSVDFLGKSIESWFDVRVEKALEGGLNLGKNSLDNSLKELTKKTQFIALLLAEKPPSRYEHDLQRLVEEGTTQEAAIFSLAGKPLAVASNGKSALPQPTLPDSYMLSEAINKGSYSVIDSTINKGLTLRALALITLNTPNTQRFIVQFTQPVAKQIETDAETVQSVYRDYQELVLSRLGLKRLYGITLTLSLLVVLLTAVSAAFFISEKLGSSLESLAEGTRAVAQGNFTGQYPIRSSDELGALTGLFNQMIRQLSDAKTASEVQQRQVESAKAYLESVLTHLSSGVIGLDEAFGLRSVNTSAAQILAVPLYEMQRISLAQLAEKYSLLDSFCHAIKEAFAETTNGEWRRQIQRLSKQGNQILLMRGTQLPKVSGGGYVVVFDDISHLLQTERQAAWGEVARRLAHEIKNPLTPIQLSAERLQHKLSSRLEGADAEFLRRATQTIVNQVGAMKNMVSDFANYARGPALKLVPLDIHELIQEVLSLYEAHAAVIELDLQARSVMVSADATRLRQVLHNVLQNAQDALLDASAPLIRISSRNQADQIVLQIEDNGTGFATDVLAKAFEPYMTTKVKGTGLGLAIVKKIVEEHNGHIDIENGQSGGASVTIYLPLAGGA